MGDLQGPKLRVGNFVNKKENLKKGQTFTLDTQNIPGLPPGIPSFPYIFNGKFFVNGNPGPINSVIISKLGQLDSPEVITGDGDFKDLIIGPRNSEDIKNRIEFFLVKDGRMIKA